ncbi:hypothetical protein [Mycobacterium sp.]|uniref:hypothetical protein n=1 Tax=Mycobacterium sp. TaxID=1785 RepID=UPI003BB1D5D8
MNNNKPVLLLAGAIAGILAISLVVRFVALSELGLPGGWLLFGLPAGGVGLLILLLRLGLINFGQGPSATLRPLQHDAVMGVPTTLPPPAVPTSKRLQEIEHLRASGTISVDEYIAERARIIASL